MRKLVLLMAIFAMAFTAKAADYAYLTFETTDGAKVSVSVSSLSTTLTAGERSFTLSNLSKMYFSESDQTTGIPSLSASELDDASEIYDLKGCKVAKEDLSGGVYVVKSKKGTYKIAVR